VSMLRSIDQTTNGKWEPQMYIIHYVSNNSPSYLKPSLHQTNHKQPNWMPVQGVGDYTRIRFACLYRTTITYPLPELQLPLINIGSIPPSISQIFNLLHHIRFLGHQSTNLHFLNRILAIESAGDFFKGCAFCFDEEEIYRDQL